MNGWRERLELLAQSSIVGGDIAAALEELHLLRLHLSDKNQFIEAMGATQERINRLKQTTTVENMAKVAADDPEGFKTILAAYMTDATDLKRARDEIGRQHAHIDLMLDEFRRIELLAPIDSEVSGICRRASEVTRQKIPVIVQRDEAGRNLAAALEEIERLKVLTADLEKEGARAIYTAVQQSERAEKAEAERDALKRHAEEVKRDLAASVVKSAELEEENSKLRSALAIVHFKREPWQ